MPNDKKYPILVVDDEKEITLSLEAFFKTRGHEMYTALDGEKALKIIDQARPELVILDIRMPKVDGKELLKRIRKNYQETKVIIITGFEEEAAEVEKLGIDGFFTKPVDMPGLIERIKYVLTTKEDTRVYPTKKPKEKPVKEVAKANKILFIEPDANVYSYTAGLFQSKDFNPGEFEVQVAYSLEEAMDLMGEKSVYGFQPDIVVMYDIHREFTQLEKIADYILHISFKPKKIIVHGIFPRKEHQIALLRQKGVIYCDQNVITDEVFRKINKRLIGLITDECIKLKLVKK